MGTHWANWKNNYSEEREDFEDYVTDVLSWDDRILAKDADGDYIDHATEKLFQMWGDGWGYGFDKGAEWTKKKQGANHV